MSAAFALYLLVTGFAALLCGYAALTAIARIPEHSASHRAWTLLAAALLPAITAIFVFAEPLELGRWRPLGCLLPVLILAATWSGLMTLRDQGAGLKLLYLPVFVFNSLLAGIYGIGVGRALGGTDLGEWGTAITAALGRMQTFVGHPLAAENPVWLHLPFVLPLSLRFGWPQRLVLLASSVLALGLLALLAWTMPFVLERVREYRGARTELAVAPHRFGLEVGWADRLRDDETLLAERRELLALGVDHVTLEVGPELFEDDRLLDQVAAECRYARDHGLELVVITTPAATQSDAPARDLHELATAMARTQWLAAERLQPDVLVLFAGPFGALGRALVRPGTLHEWMETITRCAADVRQANTKVRVAVSFDTRAPHAAELFRLLRADGSPVDAVGFSIQAGERSLRDVRTALATLARWCERTPGSRPVRVFETGASPYACGGDDGQWHFLALVLAFAHEQGARAVSIDSLTDRGAARGLIAADGRQRRAYAELMRLRHAAPQPPR